MTIATLSHILAGAALAAFVSFGAATAHAEPARADASSIRDAASALWSSDTISMPTQLKSLGPR